MNPRKANQYFTFFGVVFFVIVFVFAILYIEEKVRGISPASAAEPILTVDPRISSNLTVRVKVLSTACENTERIDYSVIELSIFNGQPPYQITVKNSKSELSGPYMVMDNDSPVQFKVYGGESFTSTVRSSIGELWSAEIGLPSEAEICKATPTPIPEPTLIGSVTNTPEPLPTDFIFPSPTLTPTATIPLTGIFTKTRQPDPNDPRSSDTPQPPKATDTIQPPKATDTTQPPKATNTTQPTVVPTPINPNPRECEDGEDNDGDGLTDYPADTDCKKPSDPKEGK